ncbi:MAG: hypothetical protein ROO70_06190 [Labrenzia sp.]
MKALTYFLAFCLGAVTIALVLNGGMIVGPSKNLAPTTFALSYSDFISALLTILALLLGTITILISIIAFRTIAEIKAEARKIASEHANKLIDEKTEKLPNTISIEVDQKIETSLPVAINERLEKQIMVMARDGKLDHVISRALIRISTGGSQLNNELDEQNNIGEGD